MVDKELFPAIVPWVRRSGVRQLTENLQEVLRQHPDTQRASIEWRPHSLTDFRPMYVPAMAERLVRWDTRHPDDVFTDGFAPRADEEWVHDQMDLWTYVQQNVPSIFVGTARYYRNDAGVATRWMPRNRASVFEYEVLAPGGLDVNLCLGLNHRFANQREIAFPGGIRREFIRSAREYNAAGHVVRLWENGFFLETFEFLAILDLIADAPAGKGVEDVYWTGRGDHTTSKRSVATSATTRIDDLMRQPGDSVPDPLLQGPDFPMLRPRAAFQRARDHPEVFFFTSNQFLRMRVTPGSSTNDVLLFGPKNVLSGWPALKAAGFATVDAVLPVPHSRAGELYFFSQDNYAMIKLANAERTQDAILASGPHKIADKWPSLRKAGFNRVDAVLPHPNASNEAYFFSGNRYALIHVVPFTSNDYIINGPHVTTAHWPSLGRAGFSTVDVAFLNPQNTDEAYFFSGDQYVLVKMRSGTTADYIITGPKKVAENWPPLREAGFYR